MIHLIMYDLSDDARRLKIAGYLEGKGYRIQESVFECDLTPDEATVVAEDLAKLAGHTPGSIRIYPVCATCYSKTTGIGDTGNESGRKGYAIF